MEPNTTRTKKPAPALVDEEGFQNDNEQDFFENEQQDFQRTTDQREAEHEQSESYYDKFRRSIMEQAKEYPLPVPVISVYQNNETIPVATLKSFSLWQGKQKSKKTTVLALAVASFIEGANFNSEAVGFVANLPGTILVFDNEQGESYAARTMKLILKLAGLDSSPNLIYCDLREYAPLERKKIIEVDIERTPGVKMVVIDGLVDLLSYC